MVRAEVVLVVTVSQVRVVRSKVGLEDVGVVEDTDDAEKVEAEVATRAEVEVELEGMDYLRCSFFARSNTTIKKTTHASL